jgi:hypothetical protein
VEVATQREVKLLCLHEVAWCHVIRLSYDEAYRSLWQLQQQSRWSKGFYAYLAMGNFNTAPMLEYTWTDSDFFIAPRLQFVAELTANLIFSCRCTAKSSLGSTRRKASRNSTFLLCAGCQKLSIRRPDVLIPLCIINCSYTNHCICGTPFRPVPPNRCGEYHMVIMAWFPMTYNRCNRRNRSNFNSLVQLH